MLFVLNNDRFIYTKVQTDSTLIVENVYGYNPKIKKYDNRPFITIIRKHPLDYKEIGRNLVRSDCNFIAVHKDDDSDTYHAYTEHAKVSEDSIAPCIVVESNINSDALLLGHIKLLGTIACMQNVWDYDIYAGYYGMKSRWQFLLKINRSFKFQEYFYGDTSATVKDHNFRYNHVKDSLSYEQKTFCYDRSFYIKNRKLFDDIGRFKNPKYDLFFIRNQKDYPR